MRSRRVSCLAVILLVLGLAGVQPATAATGVMPGCVDHSLSVSQAGSRTELDTWVNNRCGSEADLAITYRALGPCPHTMTVSVHLPASSVDVVVFVNGPCPGHYTIRQRLTGDGRRIGQDLVDYVAPGNN